MTTRNETGKPQRPSRRRHCDLCCAYCESGFRYCPRCCQKMRERMRADGYLDPDEAVKAYRGLDAYEQYGYRPENGYDGLIDNIERANEETGS